MKKILTKADRRKFRVISRNINKHPLIYITKGRRNVVLHMKSACGKNIYQKTSSHKKRNISIDDCKKFTKSFLDESKDNSIKYAIVDNGYSLKGKVKEIIQTIKETLNERKQKDKLQ